MAFTTSNRFPVGGGSGWSPQDAVRALMSKFYEVSERMGHFGVELLHLTNVANNLQSMLGRLNAVMVGMVGLPRVLKSDLHHAVIGHSGGGGSAVLQGTAFSSAAGSSGETRGGGFPGWASVNSEYRKGMEEQYKIWEQFQEKRSAYFESRKGKARGAGLEAALEGVSPEERKAILDAVQAEFTLHSAKSSDPRLSTRDQGKHRREAERLRAELDLLGAKEGSPDFVGPPRPHMTTLMALASGPVVDEMARRMSLASGTHPLGHSPSLRGFSPDASGKLEQALSFLKGFDPAAYERIKAVVAHPGMRDLGSGKPARGGVLFSKPGEVHIDPDRASSAEDYVHLLAHESEHLGQIGRGMTKKDYLNNQRKYEGEAEGAGARALQAFSGGSPRSWASRFYKALSEDSSGASRWAKLLGRVGFPLASGVMGPNVPPSGILGLLFGHGEEGKDPSRWEKFHRGAPGMFLGLGAAAHGMLNAASPDLTATLHGQFQLLASEVGQHLIPGFVKLAYFIQGTTKWFERNPGAGRAVAYGLEGGLVLTGIVTAIKGLNYLSFGGLGKMWEGLASSAGGMAKLNAAAISASIALYALGSAASTIREREQAVEEARKGPLTYKEFSELVPGGDLKKARESLDKDVQAFHKTYGKDDLSGGQIWEAMPWWLGGNPEKSEARKKLQVRTARLDKAQDILGGKGGFDPDSKSVYDNAQFLMMALRSNRKEPFYSSVEEAYKHTQVSVLGQDPIEVALQRKVTQHLQELIKIAAEQAGYSKEQADKMAKGMED